MIVYIIKLFNLCFLLLPPSSLSRQTLALSECKQLIILRIKYKLKSVTPLTSIMTLTTDFPMPSHRMNFNSTTAKITTLIQSEPYPIFLWMRIQHSASQPVVYTHWCWLNEITRIIELIRNDQQLLAFNYNSRKFCMAWHIFLNVDTGVKMTPNLDW